MRRLIPLLGLVLASAASAQPVKCVDEKGRTRYIDQSMAAQEKCKPVKERAINTVPIQSGAMNLQAPPPPPSKSGANENAIKAAEAKLAEAQKSLAEQESIRTGGEKNYARVEERLKPYQEAVEQAQKNLDQLRSPR